MTESEKELLTWWQKYFPAPEIKRFTGATWDVPDPGIHVRSAWKHQQQRIDALEHKLKLAMRAIEE